MTFPSKLRTLVRGIVFGALLSTIELAAAFAADELPTIATVSQAITGGMDVGAGEWPSVVWLGGCTGILLDPEWVVFAAHCGTGFTHARFDGLDGVRSVAIDECIVHPVGAPGTGFDVAACHLTLPVTDVVIVPPLMGCEVSVLDSSASSIVVGFGKSANNSMVGVKRSVGVTIKDQGLELFIDGDGHGTCPGDSGAPVFVQVPAAGGSYTWRVAGLVSSSQSRDCDGSPSYATRIVTVLDWIEEVTQADIAPCIATNAQWSPTPACGSFPMAPDVPRWSNSSEDLVKVRSCGVEAKDVSLDRDKPWIAGVTSRIQRDAEETSIHAGASASDNLGVKSVSFALYDGATLLWVRSDAFAPFEIEQEIPANLINADGLRLEVSAIDFNGNSTTVSIDIDDGLGGSVDASASCMMGRARPWSLASLLVTIGLVCVFVWRKRASTYVLDN